jgi:phospholipid-translocating ATPase
LIASDSNIIIIRGGNEQGRPVYQQMVHAVEKFFSDGEADVDLPPRRSTSSRNADRHHIPLERLNSGVSSIVGSENGDRPGGFVLVVDGAALLQVRPLNSLNDIYQSLSRRFPTNGIRAYYYGLPPFVKA